MLNFILALSFMNTFRSDVLRRSATLCAISLLIAHTVNAQATPPANRRVTNLPERAVRRDLPVTPAMRRAYAAGTRDSTGAPGRRYWQQRVDYRIDATLDAPAGILHGVETITLRNTTPDTLKQVVIRLYQNYFRPEVSRNDYVTDITEGIVIERLAVNGAAIPLADKSRYALNARIATVTPAAPIPPGADATIEAAWHFAVPRVDTTARAERMGRFGDYLYQVAQWYPQIAMYDDLRGWDTDQYLGYAEFNNQFGSFDVRITTPGGWLVGATGSLENPAEVLSERTRDRLALAMRVDTTVHVVTATERGAGATAPGTTLTWHFVAPNVNDFAFAASRDYVYDATHANIPGRNPVPVNLFFLPQHIRYTTNNTANFGRFALEHHSAFLFPYEFAQGTIADGPETGMEYPMIIFNGSSLGVTVHEFGHEWFPMMVGSNETRHGWMDEGFNEFIDTYAVADFNRASPDFESNASEYRRIAGTEVEAPMMWLTDYAGPAAGTATYSKAPVALHALGGVVGDSAVRLAFAAYAVAWKFKHPTPFDFFNSMSHSLGRNLDWFWYQWFFTNYTVDQSIESVRTTRDSALVAIRDMGDMAMPVLLRLDYADGTSTTVSRPADIWFGGSRRTSIAVPLHGKVLQKITVDPENRFQDLNPANNVWSSTSPRVPAASRFPEED
jgi:Peptidase family M1 domain